MSKLLKQRHIQYVIGYKQVHQISNCLNISTTFINNNRENNVILEDSSPKYLWDHFFRIKQAEIACKSLNECESQYNKTHIP